MTMLRRFVCWLRTGHRETRFGWQPDRLFVVCNQCGFASHGVPVKAR